MPRGYSPDTGAPTDIEERLEREAKQEAFVHPNQVASYVAGLEREKADAQRAGNSELVKAVETELSNYKSGRKATGSASTETRS